MSVGFRPDSIKGSGIQAYAPNYLGSKMEKWSFILCDPNQNQVGNPWSSRVEQFLEQHSFMSPKFSQNLLDAHKEDHDLLKQ